METKKRKIQFNIILVLFPLIILIILEVSLRLVGYGNKSKLFFVPSYVPDIYLENIEGYNKYVDKKMQVTSDKIENHIRNIMMVNKTPETLRGFVLGESAAQGYPYNSNNSFSKMIEVALRKTGRYKEVEILNMGVSAISSYSVRDIAKKTLDYDPDFLLIYAGNNEYYGTYSHITGAGHFARNLYMVLYELRLFQAVKGILSIFSGKAPDKPAQLNMMAERFRETYILVNEETDKTVADNYIKNIEAIVRMYAKKNIPVIIAEPVCNLIDMPPFKGENDETIATNLLKIDRLINMGNITLADSAINILKMNYSNNANVNFLDAKLHRIKNGTVDLDKYITAKNNDIIPFRPREELISNITRFCTEKKELYQNMTFIPLKEILTRQYGDTILGNSIFIDHVHFNQHGHRLIAGIVTNEMAGVLGLGPGETDSLQLFFNDEASVFKSVYSLPVYQLFANKVIKHITGQPPFNLMVFPYEYDPKELSHAINALGMEIVEKTLTMDQYDAFNSTVLYYLEKNDFQKVHEHLLADRFVFPGSYYRYLNLGRFFQMFENHFQDADLAYTQAYLFSEKKPAIYKEVVRYFNESYQFDKAAEFEKKYGKRR